MIKGLRTAIYPTPDLEAGKAWYSKVFKAKPYFDQPFYVGFEIGGPSWAWYPMANRSSTGCRLTGAWTTLPRKSNASLRWERVFTPTSRKWANASSWPSWPILSATCWA